METKSLITSDSRSNLTAMAESVSFIPSIKITYAISTHFQEGKAKLGDFYLNEQSLGNTIKATALGYRYQAIAIDKNTKDFLESLVLGESSTPFRERNEYQEFCKKHSTDDVADGVDILLFLPEHNMFGVLFCKNKLAKGGYQILEKGALGNIVVIQTDKKEWKKLSWFELIITPTSESVEVPQMDEKLTIYNSQVLQITNQTTATDEGRVR